VDRKALRFSDIDPVVILAGELDETVMIGSLDGDLVAYSGGVEDGEQVEWGGLFSSLSALLSRFSGDGEGGTNRVGLN
jgi:hypothetical protein